MYRHVLLCLFVGTLTASAVDWPEFRGPTGDGHYTGAKLPTEWGTDTKNIAWKIDIAGKGWSSPVVWKGKIFLTTAVAQDKGNFSLRALALEAATGKILWDKEVFLQEAGKSPPAHSKNSHASPTPATDGELVYVHFGHMGTAALDFAGEIKWKRTGLYAKPVHGNGGSPILVDDNLIFSIDANDKQEVVALNKKTGETAWSTARNHNSGKPFSFATPHLIDVNGKRQVLSAGSDIMAGYDPKTGKELWRTKFIGWSLIQRPVVGHGMVFYSTGYATPVLQAAKIDGTGDVTKSHIVWSEKKAVPNTPSLLLVGDDLYMLSDGGVLTCMDAKKGTIIYSERVKGTYSASPLLADGKIYLTSEQGNGTLIQAGREFKVLGEFDMKEKTFASFVGVDGDLFVRTETKLYKFKSK